MSVQDFVINPSSFGSPGCLYETMLQYSNFFLRLFAFFSLTLIKTQMKKTTVVDHCMKYCIFMATYLLRPMKGVKD